MTTISVDIPNEISKNIWIWNHIDIVELFEKFWIDLEFVLKERKYSIDFLKDLKKKDFVISNKF
jgi:hypothetical protein